MLELTLDALSARTGIHATTISLIESGRRLPPERPDVVRIAAALDLEPDSPEYARLIELAESERSERRKRAHREPGVLRKVITVGPNRKIVPPPVVSPPGREIQPRAHSETLARALINLLDLELQEGIASLQITTRTGQKYSISMMESED
ncbi:MAG: helix-turn-helix domain-containing protein [Bryobacteraceae bacterium]|nr:helix-turn-helix domain-containing protein [Bryobacteraceae bacterium]